MPYADAVRVTSYGLPTRILHFVLFVWFALQMNGLESEIHCVLREAGDLESKPSQHGWTTMIDMRRHEHWQRQV